MRTEMFVYRSGTRPNDWPAPIGQSPATGPMRPSAPVAQPCRPYAGDVAMRSRASPYDAIDVEECTQDVVHRSQIGC